MGVRNEWNTYTLGRYSEQPDATKLRATVTQAEKDRVVEQPDETKLKSTVAQAEKDRTISNDVSVIQTDHSKLKGTTKITDGTEIATITPDGYQDVKTHTPEKCFTQDYADAQVATVIIIPTAGKKIRIVSIYSSVGANATNVTLAFGTSGHIIFKHYTEKKSATVGNTICATGATNETIKLTCPETTFISIGYDEVN